MAQEIGLIESLRGEWIKLPLAVMRDVGPAVQTLGGLLKVTRNETFVSVATIAEKARVPLKTARNHLDILSERQWIQNVGRQRTRTGAPRRTCTLRVTSRTREALKRTSELTYGVLPWWACRRLNWSARAVLSILMARLMSLKAAVDQNDGHGLDASDVWSGIESLGGEDRFKFSLSRLERDTGLSRDSLITAKCELHRHKIIDWMSNNGAADILWPSESFRVVVTPTQDGRVNLAFRG
jgi:hypothetical protein